jgi:hypothetical protein
MYRPPVQSKGWPFLLFGWGINNFCFLYGKNSFARHWLFWQDAVDMVSRFYCDGVTALCFVFNSVFIVYPLQFNATNPAGDVVESDTYRSFLGVAVGIGFIVATKRFWTGLFLGRQTFCKYIFPPWRQSIALIYVFIYSQLNVIIFL